MLEIEKPNITIDKLSADGTYGVFVVEPLERGYALAAQNYAELSAGRCGHQY